jgi:hypothetical protein
MNYYIYMNSSSLLYHSTVDSTVREHPLDPGKSVTMRTYSVSGMDFGNMTARSSRQKPSLLRNCSITGDQLLRTVDVSLHQYHPPTGILPLVSMLIESSICYDRTAPQTPV